MRIECSEPFERVLDDGTIIQAEEIKVTHHEEDGSDVEERTYGWTMIILDEDVVRIQPLTDTFEAADQDDGDETDDDDDFTPDGDGGIPSGG